MRIWCHIFSFISSLSTPFAQGDWRINYTKHGHSFFRPVAVYVFFTHTVVIQQRTKEFMTWDRLEEAGRNFSLLPHCVHNGQHEVRTL